MEVIRKLNKIWAWMCTSRCICTHNIWWRLTEYFLCYSRTKRRLFGIENYHREVFLAKERRHSDEWHWHVCPTPRHFTATNCYNRRPVNNNTVVIQSATPPPLSSQQHHHHCPVSNTTAIVQSTTPLSSSSQQHHCHHPVNNTTAVVQSKTATPLSSQQHHHHCPVNSNTAIVQSTTTSPSCQQQHHRHPVIPCWWNAHHSFPVVEKHTTGMSTTCAKHLCHTKLIEHICGEHFRPKQLYSLPETTSQSA